MRPPWLDLLQVAMKPWRGRGVVVAVSGGGDSVGLLRGLVDLQGDGDFRLSVATMDHSTRDGESARDAAFVADLAAKLDLPCDLGQWHAERPGHFEADARRARHAWLLELAQQRSASAVALGQTSDDQAETILHRIIRGTGLTGLAGIPARRPLGPGVTLIRPLLGVSRQEVRAYLTTLGQDWREDASNHDSAQTRARLRHDLLPKLAVDFNPNVADALIRLGQLAAEASEVVDRQSRRDLRRLTVSFDEFSITLSRPDLSRLDPARQVTLIRHAWHRLGWPEGGMTYAHWIRLAHSGESASSRITIAHGVEAIATADHWTLRRRPDREPDPDIIPPQSLASPGSVGWREGRVISSLDPADPMDEWLDLAAIGGSLEVRAARPGDRFDPLGLAGHSQPLADFFRGRHVAHADRPLVPLVTDSQGIIWVAGHRISHRVRQTDATTRRLGLRYELADRLTARIFPA